MDTQERKQRAHDLDVTVWVGKSGIESVVDELDAQLSDRDLVKVKFLRAARAGSSTEEKAADLADRVNAELFETRGHTAVVYR
ncbi:YhbY family RNA-binding protein [Natrinema ejinorense]|uniref:RNA-binding protein n=1 Tax=Natrinema ejinorense TaxID=373386 RepID=A0A2A5QRT8_9EURY|nr:YhbY family RNA-binding protein [Natrinema ejinorense]PCR89560.1 RNA-binding protein [Natrinema ejinorense]